MRSNAICMFLEHITNISKFAPSTVKHYRLNLNDFNTYLSYKHSIDYNRSQVQPIDISEYLQYVSKRKLSKTSIHYGKKETVGKSTIANYIKSVTWFFRWYKIYVWECLDIGTIPKVKVDKPKINILNDEEIELLLTIPEQIEKRRDIALRNKLYFAMLYFSWCRASELLKVKVTDIDRVNKEVVVFGKGSKYRSVFVTDRVLEMLDEYLEERKKPFQNSLWIIIEPKETEYIFVALDIWTYWRPLSYQRVMDIFIRCSEYMGKKVHAHMLRHSFATKMFRSWVRERYIQVALWHEYITTTQRYITVCNTEIAEVHRQVFW